MNLIRRIVRALIDGASNADALHKHSGANLDDYNQPNGVAGLNEDGQIVGPIITRSGTAAEIDALVLDAAELAYATDTEDARVGDGATNGGLSIGNYARDAQVIARRGATDVLSGAALIAAYTAAAALTPGGNALSATNRAVLIVPPGLYDLDGATLEIDTDYVDVIGFGVCRAIDWEAPTLSYPNTYISGTVQVTCRNVLVKGCRITTLDIANANGCDQGRFIDIGVSSVMQSAGATCACYMQQVHASGLILGPYHNNVHAVDCSGADQSFGSYPVDFNMFDAGGHYEHCRVRGHGFGAETFSGVAVDCVVKGANSFGAGTAMTGTLRRCHIYNSSSPSIGRLAGGVLDNCVFKGGSFLAAVKIQRTAVGSAFDDNGGGSTTTVVATGDIRADVTAGTFILQPSDGTWHRVIAVAYAAPNTTIMLATAASTSFAGVTGLLAIRAPIIRNCVLISGSLEAMPMMIAALDTNNPSPVLMNHCALDTDMDSDVTNVYADGQNMVDLNVQAVQYNWPWYEA